MSAEYKSGLEGCSNAVVKGMFVAAVAIGAGQLADATGAYATAHRVPAAATTGEPQTRDLGHLEVGLNGNQTFSVGATMGVTGQLNRNSGLAGGIRGAIEVTGSREDTGPFSEEITNGEIGFGFRETNVLAAGGQIKARGVGNKPGSGIEGDVYIRFFGKKEPK